MRLLAVLTMRSTTRRAYVDPVFVIQLAYLVKQVGGFDELWPEWIELDVRGQKLPIKPLRQTTVAFPDSVVVSVVTDGLV